MYMTSNEKEAEREEERAEVQEMAPEQTRLSAENGIERRRKTKKQK